jgi:RimJ/RimL family protein N-acetyltransferase
VYRGSVRAAVERLGVAVTHHVVIQRLHIHGDSDGDGDGDGSGDPADREWDAPVAPGYRLVQWSGTAPEDLLTSYAHARQAIADAPRGTSSYRADQQWTPETIREQERVNAADGTEERVVAVVTEADGTVAAVTMVERRPHRLDSAVQLDTSVLPPHRGHGLGLAIKGAMLRTLLPAWPELEHITTSNAIDNEHMLAVNRALGYRPVREMIHTEAETARLTKNLAELA